jgi:hypothetical protein
MHYHSPEPLVLRLLQQDTHLDAIAAALAAAEREARGGRHSSEQGNPSSSFEGQRTSAEQPPAAPAKQ